MKKLFLILALLFPLISYAGPTDAARSTLATAVTTLTSQFNAIDAAANTPAPSANVPLPISGDRLAGTNPGWADGNMFADELAEVYWHDRRTLFRKRMVNSPSGSGVALGDSMLEYQHSIDLPHTVNFGIAGESARQLLYRLNDLDAKGQAGLIRRAGVLYIQSFINDGSDPRNGATPVDRAATAMIVARKLINWTAGPLVFNAPIKIDSALCPTFSELNVFVDSLWASIVAEFGTNPRIALVNLNPIVAPNGSLLPAYHNGDCQHGSALLNSLWNTQNRAAAVGLGVYPN